MATQVTGLKPAAKYAIILIVVALAVFLVNKYVLNAPKAVGQSQTVEKFQLKDMAQTASLKTTDAHLALPKIGDNSGKGTAITWQVMAWNAQFALMYANGGVQTAKGSLFDKAGVNVNIVRQDDCSKTIADFIKNANDIKNNPSTVPLIATFMGDGMPGFSVMLKDLAKLGPDYTPIIFHFMGRSNGEDGFWGPAAWKADPKSALGKGVAGVERDGDVNIVLKWASDNNIPINANTKLYDPGALNIIAASDFIDAGNKYIAGYTEKRTIVRNGKTVPDSTYTLTADAYTSWTPVDVTVAEKKGGVIKLASTKEYTSQMPAASIILRKWAYDHRTEVESIVAALGQAGDQVRSFADATKFAGDVSSKVYGDADKTGAYWTKYYNGIEEKDATGAKVQLGGSMAYNVRDAADMFGLGDDHIDRYKITYETFGGILAKFYPTEMKDWTPYGKIVDKSFLLSVVANHPELLTGEAIKQEFADSISHEVSDKSVSIEFDNGSAVIKPASYKTIDEIFNSAVISGGLKLGISGHTNRTGDESKNQTLSEARANAVVAYLKKKGLKANQLDRAKGFGSSHPLEGVDPTDPRNRRVEIVQGN